MILFFATLLILNSDTHLWYWQAWPLWRRMLRFFGWSRLTARGPACTKPPQVCVSLSFRLDPFSNWHESVNKALPFICVCMCSGAERMRPSGASARGREDHCGGDEKQRADGYRRKVRMLLTLKNSLWLACCIKGSLVSFVWRRLN